MYKLYIGASRIAVGIASALLTWLTEAIALDWEALVALGRIALLWGWASHRGSSRKVTRVTGGIRGGSVHRMATERVASVDWRRPEGLVPL